MNELHTTLEMVLSVCFLFVVTNQAGTATRLCHVISMSVTELTTWAYYPLTIALLKQMKFYKRSHHATTNGAHRPIFNFTIWCHAIVVPNTIPTRCWSIVTLYRIIIHKMAIRNCILNSNQCTTLKIDLTVLTVYWMGKCSNIDKLVPDADFRKLSPWFAIRTSIYRMNQYTRAPFIFHDAVNTALPTAALNTWKGVVTASSSQLHLTQPCFLG